MGLEHHLAPDQRRAERAGHLARDGLGLAVVDAALGDELELDTAAEASRRQGREDEQGEDQRAQHGGEPRHTACR